MTFDIDKSNFFKKKILTKNLFCGSDLYFENEPTRNLVTLPGNEQFIGEKNRK